MGRGGARCRPRGGWQPSDVVYWLMPLLCLPLILVVGHRLSEPFRELSTWKQRTIAGAVLGLAFAGSLVAALGGTDTAYLLGSLMGMPVIFLLTVYAGDSDVDPAAASDGYGGPLGLP